MPHQSRCKTAPTIEYNHTECYRSPIGNGAIPSLENGVVICRSLRNYVHQFDLLRFELYPQTWPLVWIQLPVLKGQIVVIEIGDLRRTVFG